MVFIYGLLAKFTDVWWLLLVTFLILFTTVITTLGTIIPVPLFYRIESYADFRRIARGCQYSEGEG
jgi:hypothetical protein